MIRTLVVDDEKLARDRLIGFLKQEDTVELVGQAKNGVEAVKLIDELTPDLVFLDVQMPGLDGLGVLKAISRQPSVVFATAYDQYAIKAFEVHAVDYLLKPISRARLSESVRRVRERLDGNGGKADLQQLLSRLDERDKGHLWQVPVHRAKQILILPVEDVLWFEVEYRLVYAHTEGDRYMTNFTLKQLEERLDPEVFFRAHKSRLVNLKKVKAIVPWFGGRFKLVMRDAASSEVELSRIQARALRSRMRW
jgi:DNA-binding LytR/AlgR family response regulator